MKGLESLIWKDESKIRAPISLIIHKCRYSRITDNYEDFSLLAKLITKRKDLKFTNYEEMKEFSCTEETERFFYKKFKKEYDTLFACLGECSYQMSLGVDRYVRKY